jgi:phosphotransferase system  glucose/maltose/N-acetylglucosamine-specific IIC component
MSEYLYSAPLLIRKFPLRVGLRFSDGKGVSGFDNAAGVESIEAFETRVTEVVARETLMLPAAIDTYKLQTRGHSTGTMIIGGTTSRVIITYEENLWYSEEIKEVVKSVSETTTVVMMQGVTSITRTREEKVLKSYGIE